MVVARITARGMNNWRAASRSPLRFLGVHVARSSSSLALVFSEHGKSSLLSPLDLRGTWNFGPPAPRARIERPLAVFLRRM